MKNYNVFITFIAFIIFFNSWNLFRRWLSMELFWGRTVCCCFSFSTVLFFKETQALPFPKSPDFAPEWSVYTVPMPAC